MLRFVALPVGVLSDPQKFQHPWGSLSVEPLKQSIPSKKKIFLVTPIKRGDEKCLGKAQRANLKTPLFLSCIFFKTHTAYTRKRGEDAEGATDRSQSERKIQLKRGAEFATLLEQKKNFHTLMGVQVVNYEVIVVPRK